MRRPSRERFSQVNRTRKRGRIEPRNLHKRRVSWHAGSSLVPAESSGERRAPEPSRPRWRAADAQPLVADVHPAVEHQPQCPGRCRAAGKLCGRNCVDTTGGAGATGRGHSVGWPSGILSQSTGRGDRAAGAAGRGFPGGPALGVDRRRRGRTDARGTGAGGWRRRRSVTLEGFGGYAEGGSAGDDVLSQIPRIWADPH